MDNEIKETSVTSAEPERIPLPEYIYAGEKYTQLMILAYSMRAQDMAEAEILSVLTTVNDTRCEPPGVPSDELRLYVKDAMKTDIAEAQAEAEKLRNAEPKAERETTLADALTTLEDIESHEAEWLIPGVIPRGQICLLVADGGTGKTWLWCDVAAKLSAGKRCILDDPDIPFKVRDPAKVMFFSSEDSVSTVLKPRLEKAGADFRNITTVTLENRLFDQVKIGNPALESLLARVKPELCVFDPIQSFIPGNIRMAERNAMRQALTPLIGYGEEFGTSFLVICHSNKRAGASGRQRVADSADIWDIARCVLLAGETGQAGVKYISQEKNNYGPCVNTILFSITPDADGDQILKFEGTTKKKDADYVSEKDRARRAAPERDEAKKAIENTLAFNGGHMLTSDLESQVVEYGVKLSTYKRARQELINDGVIESRKLGMKTWYTAVAGWYESLTPDEMVSLAKPNQEKAEVNNATKTDTSDGVQLTLDDL